MDKLYLRYYDKSLGEHKSGLIGVEDARKILASLIKVFESEITTNLAPVVGVIEARVIHDEQSKDVDVSKRRYLGACYITSELRRIGDDTWIGS